MDREIVATATDGEILVKFFSDDTVGFFLQEAEQTREIGIYPMKPQLARDRAIAAKHNGNIFGREMNLIVRMLELYITEPEVEAIA